MDYMDLEEARTVPHPFQKICSFVPAESTSAILYAASASQITCFDLSSGEILSRWPPVESENIESKDNGQIREDERPNKRRRTDEVISSQISRQDSEDSIEILAERKKGERRKPKKIDQSLPKITHLLPVPDGRHLIIVTAEDKSITVFEVGQLGVLTLKSKRALPKRLCAITLTTDGHTILAGDKFGDVYSLPLQPSAEYVRPQAQQNNTDNQAFKTSATELTVHTKGNREALRQQQIVKKTKVKKEGLDFEHTLLLGHVSLLTDVVVAQMTIDKTQRQFVITSDRDEHIRVSRGIPQTHVIENYCLGHQEFVSCLCVLPAKPSLLIAGSGEPSLKVFEWSTGRLLDQELFLGTIRQDIEAFMVGMNGERAIEKLAVSKILLLSSSTATPVTTQPGAPTYIAVAFEGLPVILIYSITDDGQLKHHQTIKLVGNVLDISCLPKTQSFLVSEDIYHLPGSMKSCQPAESVTFSFFETYQVFGNSHDTRNGQDGEENTNSPSPRWERSSAGIGLNNAVQVDLHRAELKEGSLDSQAFVKQTYSSVGDFLYGLEHLRKRRGIADAEEVGDVEEEDDAAGDNEVPEVAG